MRINEVNPNPQLQEAGEIVQQMYHKKHMAMSWPSDTKPTIRGLVEELDDPLLLSFTADLEHFIHYGQAYIDLNPNDIWQEKSGLATVDDMMKDPIYFANEKSTVYEIVQMRPTMYAIHSKHGFQGMEGGFTPEPELIHEYTLKVLDGSKMPLPYLKYQLVEDERRGTYTSFGQEGRHRATVAQILGATSMPCIVIAGLYRPSDDKSKLRDYSGQIFDKFN